MRRRDLGRTSGFSLANDGYERLTARMPAIEITVMWPAAGWHQRAVFYWSPKLDRIGLKVPAVPRGVVMSKRLHQSRS